MNAYLLFKEKKEKKHNNNGNFISIWRQPDFRQIWKAHEINYRFLDKCQATANKTLPKQNTKQKTFNERQRMTDIFWYICKGKDERRWKRMRSHTTYILPLIMCVCFFSPSLRESSSCIDTCICDCICVVFLILSSIRHMKNVTCMLYS